MSETCVVCRKAMTMPIVTEEGFMCESCFYDSSHWKKMKEIDKQAFLIRMMKISL